MTVLRQFRNDDLPGLLRAYREHWSAAGVSASVNAAILERVFLCQPGFDPRNLLIATQPPCPDDRPPSNNDSDTQSDRSVDGWCLVNVTDASMQAPGVESGPGASVKTCEVISLCFARPGRPGVGDELLRAAERRAVELGGERMRVTSLDARPSGTFGLSPIGSGIGVPIADVSTSSALSRAGYRIDGERLRMVADPTTYRPPIDRDLLMLRRSTRIEHQAMMPTDPKWASATSHLDLLRHHLINHRDGGTMASLDVWLSDLEVALMEGSRAILDVQTADAQPIATTRHEPDPPHSLATSVSEIAQRFLVASVVQTLAARSIFHVEASVLAGSPSATRLEQVGFHIAERGRVWSKELT